MGALEILKRSEVFLGLDDSDLQKVVDLPSCREEFHQAQEVILKKWEEAKDFYVLAEGQVNLVVDLPGSPAEPPRQVIARIITRGGTFGWSALVSPHVRTMAAICKEPSRLVAIAGAELNALFDKEPYLGYQVMKGLVRVIGWRLRDVEQLLITGKRSPFFDRPKVV